MSIWGGLFGDFDFHLVLIEVSELPEIAQLLARGLASGLGAAAGQQQIQQVFFRLFLGLGGHPLTFLVAHELDADFHEIADHGFHIAAHVADFRVLGGLHLDEGRAGESGQPAGYLGFAHAGGPHENDVLGRDFVAQGRIKLLTPPAVAHRHGHHALGLFLSDDIFVELGNNLPGGQRVHEKTPFFRT